MEAHEEATVLDGEREQVRVRHLPMPEHMGPADRRAAQQIDRVGPERVRLVRVFFCGGQNVVVDVEGGAHGQGPSAQEVVR